MLTGKTVWMATGNHHKYIEARDILSEMGVELRHLPVEKVEIQADYLAEIAAFSVDQVVSEYSPIVVEDAGLFIDCYSGFPGPYSSYALRKIGLSGVLMLMKGLENRTASFKSAVALRSGGETKVFRGIVHGRIALDTRGTEGFGYDPIFIPDEGEGRTFGEMSSMEKNEFSHRARAFRNLGKWLSSA